MTSNHQRRLAQLEHHIGPARPSVDLLAEAIDELLHGPVDAIGGRIPGGRGWLDDAGQVRDDLSPDDRATAEEVLAILGRASERARLAGDHDTHYLHDRGTVL